MNALAKANVKVMKYSALEDNVSPNLYRACRPWDRGDLFRRLSTFKSMTWFGKPEVAGPLNCARNGWINVDVDLIACEGCNAMLSFPCQPTWSQHEVENAAADFGKKLECGHAVLCPWKGNPCAENLARFPPTPKKALVDGFQARCDTLNQLSALPALSNSIIDFLKQSKEPHIERFISQSAGNHTSGKDTSNGCASSAYFQAQRIIGLCGWELRLLPYVVDCEDDNKGSVSKTVPSVSGSNVVNTWLNDCGPRVLLYPSTKEWGNKSEEGSIEVGSSEQKHDLGSAVLDCSLCGASVGLWSFSKIPRPSHRTRAGPLMPDTDSAACEVSCASVIQKENRDNQVRLGVKWPPKEDAATSNRSNVDVEAANMLTLNLTIAGGPCPSSAPHCVRSKLNTNSDNHCAQDVVIADTLKLLSETVEGKGAPANNIKKRKRSGAPEHIEVLGQNMGFPPCLSSVNAVDTCFSSRPETSAESVEMPSKYQHLPTTESSHFRGQSLTSDGGAEDATSSKAYAMPQANVFQMNIEHESLRKGSHMLDGSTGEYANTLEESHTVERDSTIKNLFDESSREFDPVLQHRHFCPWVNTSCGGTGCGWQLTLDALEALAAPVRSESASSVYNENPLSFVRKIFGKPHQA